MYQLYLFIISLILIVFIVFRRNYIVLSINKKNFKKEISVKVDQMQKERRSTKEDRFKENYLKEQSNTKYDFAFYKNTLRKADIAISKSEWNDAKRLLIQSIAIKSDDFNTSLKLAKVYLESGDIKKAEELYDKLLEIDNLNPIIYENLAKVFVAKKKYKEAVSLYVQSIELDPKDDKKLVELGKIYVLLMRPSLSAECFKRAAELKPRKASYLFLLGDACRKDGDYENALFAYEKILTIEPYNEKAQDYAQDVRIQMNNLEKTIHSIK